MTGILIILIIVLTVVNSIGIVSILIQLNNKKENELKSYVRSKDLQRAILRGGLNRKF